MRFSFLLILLFTSLKINDSIITSVAKISIRNTTNHSLYADQSNEKLSVISATQKLQKQGNYLVP